MPLLSFLAFANLLNAQIVTIGSQVWTTKNLNVITFRNGDTIPEAKTAEEWLKAGKNKQPAWCYYNNAPSNWSRHGKIYNWYAVNDKRGLAPAGFHIPTDAEWTTLVDYLGVDADKKMKSTYGWDNIGSGNNSSGFLGFPGGYRSSYDGSFGGIGDSGFWWSATEHEVNYAWTRWLNCCNGKVIRGNTGKNGGNYVRCIKD